MFRKIACSIAIAGLGLVGACSAQPSKVQDIAYIADREFLIIAHRGASGQAPEHTMPAFELAVQQDADFLEFDVQATKDGHLVIIHDRRVDRTTDGKGLVRDYTLNELKELDAGSWFNEWHPAWANPSYEGESIPTLEEALGHFKQRARFYIELKDPSLNEGMEEQLIESLEKYGLSGADARPGQVMIESFSESSLRKLHKLDPDIPLIQLLSYERTAEATDRQISEWKEYAVGIGLNYDSISRKFTERVKGAGLLIHPYTVNEEETMRKLADWGVTGVFTDFPGRMKEIERTRNEEKR